MRVIAQRYGAALAEVALANNQAEPVRKDLGDVIALLGESAELRHFLHSPAVSTKKKHSVMERIASHLGMSVPVRNLLFVLLANGRMRILEAVQTAFEDESRARTGRAEAIVTSAREFGEEEKAELSKVLEKKTGKKIEAKYRQDPELLAGVVVRIGSTIYDWSVRGQLQRLRSRLVAS